MRSEEKLSPKQQRFVAEYLVDFNATKAAERAGYSPKTARQTGYENLTKSYIQAEIERQNKERTERLEVKADDVLRELRLILDFDIRGLFDESGKLKPIHALTQEQAKALASYRVSNRKGAGRNSSSQSDCATGQSLGTALQASWVVRRPG